MLPLLGLFALALGALSAPVLQDGCRRCDHRGMVACGEHPEYEGGVLYCSVAAACPACGGSLLVDCEHCEGGPDVAVAAERLERIAKWTPPTDVEGLFVRPLARLETERFNLIVETGELREGKKKRDQHLIAHAIAGDVQAVERRMAEHFAVAEGDYDARMRMWIWSSLADHKTAMTNFLESSSTGDFKMLGKDPVFSVWTERPLFDEVPEVRSLFAHNAAHMLLSNMQAPLWFGDTGGGWFDAAVGHWYEYELFERTTNYCIEEANFSENYENGQWRAAIRKRLSKEDEPLLPGLLVHNTGGLRQSEQALCWSFYDYLVANHPSALRPILDDLKARRETREIFQERLGLSVLEADAAWRAWVPTVYPTKGDSPREPGRKR